MSTVGWCGRGARSGLPARASTARLLPGAENSDEGGARDTNEEPDNSGGLVGEVPGYVGEVPGWGAAKSLP